MKRAALTILAAGTIASAVLAFVALRDRTPLLTRAALKEAHDRWERTAPPDYDLELVVEVDGVAPQHYKTQVRGRRVALFEQNGRENDGGSEYNVAGLFEWIERDLEMSTRPPIPGAPVNATLKARFDPQRGYPLVFKRIATDGKSVFIRVERFEAAGEENQR